VEEELIARLRVVGQSGFRRSLTGASGSLRTFGGVAGMVARTGLAALTAGLAAGATAGFSYNKMIDSQRVGFTTLLGSQKRAVKYMRQIRQIALKSPVLDPQTTGDAARTFIAYGINAKSALKYVKALGDMSAATGRSIQDTMPRGAMAIGQIASKGKLSMEELNQLAESVGLSQKRIRRELGMTRAEFAQTFTPGNQISASKALPAILKAMEKQSGGAANRLSKTTAGRLDQLREVFKMKMGALTRGSWSMIGRWAHGLTKRLKLFDPKAFLRGVKDFASDVKGVFQGVTEAFSAGFHGENIGLLGITDWRGWANQIGRWEGFIVKTVIPGVVSGLKGLVGFVRNSVIPTVKDIGKWFAETFGPAMPFITGVVIPSLKFIARIVGKMIVNGAKMAGGALVLAFKVASPVLKLAAKILGWIGNRANDLKPIFRVVGGVLEKAFTDPVGVIKGVFGGIVGFFRGRVNNLIDIINFAIKQYNKIPLAPNIGLIGHVGGGGGSDDAAPAPPPSSAGNSVRGTGGLPGGLPNSSGGNTSEGGRHTRSVSPTARIGSAPTPLGGRAALWHLTVPVQIGRRELGRATAKITADDLARSGRGG
jgi:tape measure domain-containing protein